MGNKVVMSVGVITNILLSEACSLLIRFLIRIYCEGKNVRKCIKLPTAAWSWVNVQPCNYGDGKNEIFLHCRKILYNVYSTTQREWAIKLCTLCIALLNDLPVADGFNYFKNYLVIVLPQNYPYDMIWMWIGNLNWNNFSVTSKIQDSKWFPWSRCFWSRQFQFKLPVRSCYSLIQSG